jgi:hypothetical protein
MKISLIPVITLPNIALLDGKQEIELDIPTRAARREVGRGSKMSTPHDRGFTEIQPFSVYAEGQAEALKFKWTESEKANRDLGELALCLWQKKHWRLFLRSRWLEHLEGKRFCSEFNADQFGLLQRPITSHQMVLDRILDLLKMGRENLEILIWAVDSQIPCDPVQEILSKLRLNDSHLPPPFEHLAKRINEQLLHSLE